MKNINVLIVDDDDMVRNMLAELVKSLGHSVTKANGASMAIALLEINEFDLVVTDNDMPFNGRLTSDEGVRVVAAADKVMYRPYQIVWMSGRADDLALMSKVKVAGADKSLSKPFPVQEFLTILEEVASHKEVEMAT